MTIHQGTTYRIKNAKSGTYLDKSGSDDVSILGWEGHNGDNQQWTLDQIRGTNQWHFRNRQDGKFLSIALGAGGARDDTPVIASEHEYGWDISPSDQVGAGYRIFVPGTPFNLDLTNFGDSRNGTKVAVWGKNNHNLNQIWLFEQV